ncbi:MAG TPA: MFS transporter, partial [Acidimicrobiales bacterium]|nr:MFS transporter [Acidimicrobiales bacterium]
MESTPPTPAALPKRQVLIVFSGIMLGMLLAAVDQTIVATALPTITGELGGLDHLAWVITAYLLAETVATPVYGKLGDLYGRKRLFQSAIIVFLVGSALSGVANSMGMLIAFRAVQGVGAGGLIVLAQALIADIVSPRERGRYQGFFGAVFGAASVAGPLLGGYLTDHLSWRWVFYVNLPLGVLALVVTSATLPSTRLPRPVRIDWAGTILLAGAISSLVLLTTWGGAEYAWASGLIVGLGIVTVALALAFVAVERRTEEPAIPLRLFGLRTFNIAAGVSLIVGVALYGAI